MTNEIGTLGKLAIDGGEPVRTRPLPWELPGAHWIGAEEEELVGRVIRARSPFRFYGLDPQNMADTLEREWKAKFGATNALAMGSGTAALQQTLESINNGTLPRLNRAADDTARAARQCLSRRPRTIGYLTRLALYRYQL